MAVPTIATFVLGSSTTRHSIDHNRRPSSHYATPRESNVDISREPMPHAPRQSSNFDGSISPTQEGTSGLPRQSTSHPPRMSFAVDDDAAERSSVFAPHLDLDRIDENDPILLQGPPPLDYTLHTRKHSIAIFWSLILFDSIAIPIGLYFGLWYGTNLSPNAVFSISTGCLGGVSTVEYVIRFWRLWKQGSTCRVLGARRAYLDWFHWNFSAAWFFVVVELVIGTAFPNPPIRLLAMPVSSLLFWFAFQLLLEDTLRLLGQTSPIRISSMPAGSKFRPGIYSIIEDVVAVDGSGGTRFRKRLNDRFEASHYFRQMLHRLTLFWATGALICAVVTTILVFTLPRDGAYVVGWTLPFLWAGSWVIATFWYVKKELRHERAEWRRVVQAEGVKGAKKWQTIEPRVRLLSVAPA